MPATRCTTIARAGAAEVLLSVKRSGRAEPYSERDVEALTQVLPHIRRAGQLALSVGLTRGEGMVDAFVLLDRPGLLLDPFGSVLRCNAAAERLLGPDLFIKERMLVARNQAASAGLHRLTGEILAGVADASCAPVRVPVPRTFGRPLVVHGVPLVGSARDPFQAAKAILTIVDPEQGRDLGKIVLRQACGLRAAKASTAPSTSRAARASRVSRPRGMSASRPREPS